MTFFAFSFSINPGQPLAHFVRGLVGESHREDVLWAHPLRDEERHAHGDDTRLARAGAGEDEHRPLGRANGFLLLGVEIEESEGGHGAVGEKQRGSFSQSKTPRMVE